MAPTQRQITDFGAMSWAPYIHPSGQYIIFASNKLGFENFEVFMVDIDGKKEPVRVTYSDGFDGLPVPSPDGTQLAWTSSRGGGREGQIFLAQWNHREGARGDQERTSAKGSEMSARRMRALFAAVLVVCGCRSCRGAARRAQTQTSATRAHVETLASEKFGGREAGSPGERLAADYIAAQLARLGARPLPGRSDMFVPFDSPPAAATAARARSCGSHDASTRRRTSSRSPSPTTARSSGPVVFAGYGIVVPESQNFGYDSYATLDVKDKIVVVLRYFPEDADQQTRGDPRALLRPSLQGDGGAAARRQGAARRHRAALAERRPDRSDDVRHGARRLGHSGGQRQRRGRRGAVRRRAANARRPCSRSSTPAIRTSPASPARAITRHAEDRRSSAKRRPAATSSRIFPATTPVGRRRRSRGSRSARTTITSGAARNGNSLAARGRGRQAASRRRRQRLGHRRGARDRRRARQAARASPQSARRALVGRGDRPRRLGGVRQRAAGSGRINSPRT